MNRAKAGLSQRRCVDWRFIAGRPCGRTSASFWASAKRASSQWRPS